MVVNDVTDRLCLSGNMKAERMVNTSKTYSRQANLTRIAHVPFWNIWEMTASDVINSIL